MFDTLVSYDIATLHWLQSFIDPSSYLEILLIRIGSDSELIAVAIILVTIWILGVRRHDIQYRRDALTLCYALIFGLLVYMMLKW